MGQGAEERRMNGMLKSEGFQTGLLAGLILCLVACFALLYLSCSSWRQDAVNHGAAEWIMDEKGSVTWQWKDEGG